MFRDTSMMEIEEVAKMYSNHASFVEEMDRNLEAENGFKTSELILDENNCEHTRSEDNDTIGNGNKRTWSDCECNREENANKKLKTTQICTETEITSDSSPEIGNNISSENIEASEQILEKTIQKLEPTLLCVSKAIPKSEAIFEYDSSKVYDETARFPTRFPTSIKDNNIEILEEETSDNENYIHNFEIEKTKDIFNIPKREHDKNNVGEEKSVEANYENHDIFDNSNKEAEKNNEIAKEQELYQKEEQIDKEEVIELKDEVDKEEKNIKEIFIEKQIDDKRRKQKDEVEEEVKEEKEEESKEPGNLDAKEREKNKKEEINKEDEGKTKEETPEEKVDAANKEEIKKEEATITDVEIIHENEKFTSALILTNKIETKHIDEEISSKIVEESAIKLEEENQASTSEDRKDANFEPAISTTDYVQRSEMNSKLIQPVLNHRMALYFQNKCSRKPYALNLVQEGSYEYRLVKDLFSLTLPTSRTFKITKLERVENPYLLGMYLLKKEKMESQGTVVEKSLFHGTPIKSIDGICRYNFDWRRCGQSRGHKFGQGVSFSPQVSYADHYTHGDNVMILAKVLVSKIVSGQTDTVIPREPYDTTRNHDSNVLVKYEDDDFYPQYVIYYKDDLFDDDLF